MPLATAIDIPAELWLDIWLRLEYADRVTSSRTCSQWRAIALESQDLWREVHVHAPLSIAQCSQHENAPCMPVALQRLLERSGTSTISLFLAEHGSKAELSNLLRMLSPHLHRVERLKLSYSEIGQLDTLLSYTPAWPILRALETTCLFGYAEGERNHRCPHGRERTTFANIELPALEHALFTADHELMTPSLRCLPHTLTHLQLEVNTVAHLIPALEHCPNLMILRVGFWKCHEDPHNADYESKDDRIKIRDLADSIPDVTLAVCDEASEARALEALPAIRSRRTVHLIHRGTRLDPLPSLLFDGIEGVLNITVKIPVIHETVDVVPIEIGVVDACGTLRQATFVDGHEQPTVLFAALWGMLEGRIERLKIDTALLQQATETLDAEMIKRTVVALYSPKRGVGRIVLLAKKTSNYADSFV